MSILTDNQGRVFAAAGKALSADIGGGGGGGGASQRLVVDMTTTEAVSQIVIDKDANGLPFSMREAHIYIFFPKNPDNAENSTNCWIFPDSKIGNAARITGSIANKTTDRSAVFDCFAHRNLAKTVIGSLAGSPVYAPNSDIVNSDDGFCYFKIESKTAGNQFAAGTRVVIWGIDQ